MSVNRKSFPGLGAAATKTDAMTAVALQDHLVRNMNVNLSLSNSRLPKKNLQRSLAYKKPVGKAVVDTNRAPVNSKRKTDKPKEYVLDEQPPPPTLAQRLGLIEQPKSLLNEREWAEIKHKAHERQEFVQPCVICKEEIGKLCHVILSCTHVFHKNCLQAFERFSGKKTCPMCRKEQYQTRVIHDGSHAYQNKCATRLQATWRGYVVRCWYKKLRQTVPPKDPKLRRKFYEDKLHSITDRMVKSLDMGVNQLLYEVNQNLEASRLIFELFDARQKEISAEQWISIYKKAAERRQTDCAICLTRLDEADTERRLSLTSCTHLFHDVCLTMFETLSDADKQSTCPVCRCVYRKQIIPLHFDNNSLQDHHPNPMDKQQAVNG